MGDTDKELQLYKGRGKEEVRVVGSEAVWRWILRLKGAENQRSNGGRGLTTTTRAPLKAYLIKT